MRRGALLGSIAIALLVDVPRVEAQSKWTTQFNIQATVVSSCTFSTTTLIFPIAKNQAGPSKDSTLFTVSCPAATAAHPLPVTFTFEPLDGSTSFIMAVGGSSKQIPYEFCTDQTCGAFYTLGAPGPIVSVNNSTFSHEQWGIAYPNVASPGLYRQDVNVTLTF